MGSLLNSPFADLARELLSILSQEDLLSLVKTSSCGRIMPVNEEEAITAVLLTCQSIADLLTFRKLTSHVLMRYLLTKDINVDSAPGKTKMALMISDYWKSRVSEGGNTKATNNNEPQEDTDTATDLRIKIKEESSDKKNHVKQENSRFEMPNEIDQNSSFDAESRDRSNSLGLAQLNMDNVSISSNQIGSVPSTSRSHLVSNCDTYSNSNMCPNNSDLSSCHTSTNSNIVRVMSDKFSKQYCEWFYNMLNRLQPQCQNTKGDELGVGVFCSNCKVEMYLVDGENSEQCNADGDESVHSSIRQLLTRLNLLFVPNLEGGIQAMKSSHGMVLLLCCGTLHCGSAFIGIFEQEFGLVMCPIDKTWKIAYTKINLKKMVSASKPTLPSSEVFAIEY